MPARPAVSPSRQALDLYAQSLADFAEHGDALKTIIQRERKRSDGFLAFLSLCRGSLNPELSEAAVEEMLIQHFSAGETPGGKPVAPA